MNNDGKYLRPVRRETEAGTMVVNVDYIEKLKNNNQGLRDRVEEKSGTIKLQRKVIGYLLAGVLLSNVVWAGIFGLNRMNKPDPVQLPDGYVTMYINDSIGSGGDNIYNNALAYWDPNVYGFAYEDINHYVDSIASASGIKYPDNVQPGQRLNIPVIVSVESEAFAAYQRIQELTNEINDIIKNNYWSSHTINLGDSLLGLAGRSAGSTPSGYIDTNMQYSIRDEIMSKNGMSDSFLRDGRTIQIVNPELGPLRTELNTLNDQIDNLARVNREDTNVR